MTKAELEARRDESTDTFRFKFAHNGYSSGKNYRLVFELLKKVIAEKKIAIEVIEIPCQEIQDLEYQLQSANAKLSEMANAVLGACPEDFMEGACMFCDMGDAGYSSKGPNTHDDKCVYRIARGAMDASEGNGLE